MKFHPGKSVFEIFGAKTRGWFTTLTRPPQTNLLKEKKQMVA